MTNHLEQLAKEATTAILAQFVYFDDMALAFDDLDEDDRADFRQSVENIIKNALYAESERGER